MSRKITIISVLILIFVVILIWLSYRFWSEWAGLYTPENGVYEDWKLAWDWLDLIIVPLVLALGVWWLNDQARKREEAARHRQEIERIERLIRQMGSSSTDGTAINALKELSAFVSLSEGALREANLQGANLPKADLHYADLHGVNLYGAILDHADLRWANLDGANLQEATLINVNLQGASLQGANLRMTKLFVANLSGADLIGVDLSGAEYNHQTTWSAGYNPGQLGAKLVIVTFLGDNVMTEVG